MPMMGTVFLQGLVLSLGLIIAIGAQNAFVLRQGLRREHVASVVFFCAISDALLITAGVLGMAQALGESPMLANTLAMAGAVFLAVYGWKALRRASQEKGLLAAASDQDLSWTSAMAQAAAFTLLNPHVYLDTVVLVGSIGTTFAPEQRPYFLLGAASASLTWFFGIALGGRVLRPLFKKALAWQLLDGFSALVMFWVAYQLARFVLRNAA